MGTPAAQKLTSKTGRQLVAEGMRATRAEFDAALAHVRYLVEHFTDEQIYNEQFQVGGGGDGRPRMVYHLSRWEFAQAGGYGHSCYVYGAGEATQLPLRLAWAVTIHKSQGLSLDAAEIDLRRAFLPGMGYVALSRIRHLDGLYLLGLNGMALQMNPELVAFDRRLREASEAGVSAIGRRG